MDEQRRPVRAAVFFCLVPDRLAERIRTANYHWRSIRNWVYIIGLVRSAAERDTILLVIQGTKGVQGYKDFIEIKQVK